MLQPDLEVAMRWLRSVSAFSTVVLLFACGATAQGLGPTEPVAIAGAIYYPSGPTVFFDGAAMVHIGSYKGVPVYVDPTRDPYNVVYLSMGGKLMRPYERPRADRAADLAVPPPPSAPIEPEAPQPEADLVAAPPEDFGPPPVPPRPIAPARSSYSSPGDNRGIWIAFENRIWVLADRRPYSTGDLKRAGDYHGFAVFRDPAHKDQIYVSSGADDFLARYTLADAPPPPPPPRRRP
jgi:hypothetical protein